LNHAAAAAFRAQGIRAGYNLDYDEAVAAFRQAIEADPDDPAAPPSRSAAGIMIRTAPTRQPG
jgi:Flp pilus assembly protein TadD